MKIKHVLIGVSAILVIILLLKVTGIIGKKKPEKVTIDNVEIRKVTETITASGKIQPETEVKLSSEVSGEVTELLVKEGDVVKKGQLLCKVRPDVLRSGYERAVANFNSQKASVASAQQQLIQSQANFANAEATYKRNVELYIKKVISASEFDAAKAAFLTAKANLAGTKENVIAAKFTLEQAKANVKEASANLAKTTIYSPVDGVVSKLSIELGDRILGTSQMAGTEIMRISNLTNMEVNVAVNENDINRVVTGDSAVIQVDAFGDKKFRGVVTEIASSSTSLGVASPVDQVTNFSVKVRIITGSYNHIKNGVKNLPSPFRPGLSASVDIESETERALAVPIQAVFTDNKNDVYFQDNKSRQNEQSKDKQKDELTDKKVKQYIYQFNAKNKTIKKVEVTTGIQDDRFIILKTGLKQGQQIVSGPYSAIQNKLKDGAMVEPTTKDKLFAAESKK